MAEGKCLFAGVCSSRSTTRGTRFGQWVGLATLAACARRVVGICALDNAWGSLRSPPALESGWYVCVRLRVGLASLAACARRVIGVCASDMVGTKKKKKKLKTRYLVGGMRLVIEL